MTPAAPQGHAATPQAPPAEGLTIGLLYGLPTAQPGPGGSTRGHYLVRGLSERGHRVLSWRDGQGDNPLITDHPRRRDLRAFLRAIDVLYIRVGPETRQARWGLLKLLRRKRPLPVVWELTGLPEDLLFNEADSTQVEKLIARLKWLAKAATAGVGLTERMSRFLEKQLEIPLAATVPNASDPELFRPNQPGEHGPLRVAWVGSAHPQWYEMGPLLDAATRLAERKSPVRFHVFAPRERLPETLPENLQCHGWVPYEKLGRYLGKIDVGVLLLRRCPGVGLRDGSPGALFDFMASGQAVVSQDDGQIGQVMRIHHTGPFTVANGLDLARVLLRLHANRQQLREFGQAGRAAVEKHFCWSRVVDQTEDLIRQAVQAAAPPPG